MGFDPSQLSVFTTPEKQQGGFNALIYRTRPADSKSEDHVYRCTIKVIYSPQDMKHSILERQLYSLHDAEGYFNVVSSLTNNDLNCPVFKAWKKCHYAKREENPILWAQAAKKEDGGKELFDKRYERYVTIQVLEDKNQPDLVGKYLFWKMPKSVWDVINSKMNPAKESGKAAIPVMDFLFGRAIELEVKPGPGAPTDVSYTRETSYMPEISEDVVSCVNPDGTPILNASEQAVYETYVAAMKRVWKERDPETRSQLLAQVNADANTAEFRKIYAHVLEDIKQVCPDLNAELGYKAWAPEVAARVEKWINTVLAGNDPAEGAQQQEVAEVLNGTTATPVEEETPSTAVFDTAADVDSDLPF